MLPSGVSRPSRDLASARRLLARTAGSAAAWPGLLRLLLRAGLAGSKSEEAGEAFSTLELLGRLWGLAGCRPCKASAAVRLVLCGGTSAAWPAAAARVAGAEKPLALAAAVRTEAPPSVAAELSGTWLAGG